MNEADADKAFEKVADGMLAAEGHKAGVYMALATNALSKVQVGNLTITVGNN